MLKPFAITLEVGSSLANRTGSWRTERPNYRNLLPPCNHACPAGENIQGWLYYAESGDYHKAWQVLVENNPLPAIMGRACYHPCETSCNRAQLDKSVNIHAVERFLGDPAIEKNWQFDPPPPATGKRVLVVGSGPSGLSAAYHLARLGHQVTIYAVCGDGHIPRADAGESGKRRLNRGRKGVVGQLNRDVRVREELIGSLESLGRGEQAINL